MLIAKRKDKNGNTHELHLVEQPADKRKYWRFSAIYFKGTKEQEQYYTMAPFDTKMEAMTRVNDALSAHDFELQESILFCNEFIGGLMTAIDCLENHPTEQREIAAYYLKRFLDAVN